MKGGQFKAQKATTGETFIKFINKNKKAGGQSMNGKIKKMLSAVSITLCATVEIGRAHV